MNREIKIERASLLRRLLVGENTDETQLGHVATAFNLPVRGRFRVLAASPRYSRPFRKALRSLTFSVDVHAVDGMEIVILQDDTTDPRSWPHLHTLPAGISPPVDGLGQLASAWQVARRLAALVDSPASAVTVDTHWAYLVGDGLGVTHRLVYDERFGKLDALTDDRREAIVDAVTQYMMTGSINESGRSMYLHRNTLLNGSVASTS